MGTSGPGDIQEVESEGYLDHEKTSAKRNKKGNSRQKKEVQVPFSLLFFNRAIRFPF